MKSITCPYEILSIRFPNTPPANIPSETCPTIESNPKYFLKSHNPARASIAIEVKRYVRPESIPQAAPSFVMCTM